MTDSLPSISSAVALLLAESDYYRVLDPSPVRLMEEQMIVALQDDHSPLTATPQWPSCGESYQKPPLFEYLDIPALKMSVPVTTHPLFVSYFDLIRSLAYCTHRIRRQKPEIEALRYLARVSLSCQDDPHCLILSEDQLLGPDAEGHLRDIRRNLGAGHYNVIQNVDTSRGTEYSLSSLDSLSSRLGPLERKVEVQGKPSGLRHNWKR